MCLPFTGHQNKVRNQKCVIAYTYIKNLYLNFFFRNNCRLQAQQGNSEAAYKGMSDVFWRTLKHEGVSGFYKGILPNLLKVVPAASITYMVYEAMKKNLSLD
jgi:hypothetical protein